MINKANDITSFDENNLPVLKDVLDMICDQALTANELRTMVLRYFYFVLPEDVLTIGADKLGRFYIDFDGTIERCDASVKTAPTGADILCDINLNGTSIFGTRITIAATANTGTTSAFAITDVASGDYFTFDVDQVGSTVAGAKLVIRLTVKQGD